MKTTLIALFFILVGSVLYGQDTLTIYYKENGKPTEKQQKADNVPHSMNLNEFN